MSKKRYHVEVAVTAVLEVDDEVIERVDDEWRGSFYNLCTPEEVVEHLSYNLLRGADLTSLDGWADAKDGQAQMKEVEYVDWIVVPLGPAPVPRIVHKRRQQVGR